MSGMSQSTTLIASAVSLALAGGASAADPPLRPNVIVILTDNQGSADAGCYGVKDLITPAIDLIAARGVRFTQFYAAAPVCSPSRAGLLTGRYPLRCGVTGNCASQRGGKEALPASEKTMADMFRAAGYRTAHVGKWHLGYTPETMPNVRGFDRSFGHMGGCMDNWSHFFYWAGPNVHDLHRDGVEVHEDGRFFPDLCVEEASRFMEANRERPFFLYWRTPAAQRRVRP
jgi:arylsulfatase A